MPLVTLGRVVARNVKGRDFELDLRRPTLVVGPNGSGKSSRLIALNLALAKRVGGSPVPSELGDEAADTGDVGVGVEGRTASGDVFRIDRMLGSKHSAYVEAGAVSARAVKEVEQILADIFGTQRGECVNLEWFTGMSADKQARFIAEVTGVSLDAPDVREELDVILRDLKVEWEDARGAEQRRPLAADVLVAVRKLLDAGLAGAIDGARENKNAAQRDKLAAEKTRKRLLELAREDIPPGRLAEVRAELATREENLRRVREQQAARDAEMRGRLAAQDRLARAEVERQAAQAELQAAQRMDGDVGKIGSADVDNAVLLLRRASAEKEDAANQVTTARSALAVVTAQEEAVAKAIADLEERGVCPTCGASGESLAEALAALRRRQKVIGLKRKRATDEAMAVSKTMANAIGAYNEALAEERRVRQRQASVDSLSRTRTAAQGRMERADAALATSRQAASSLPQVEALDDLLAERVQLEGACERLRSEVIDLAAAEESDRARAQNEADLNLTLALRAGWAAVEAALVAFSRELTKRAVAPVEEAATRIVAAVYLDVRPSGQRRFAFRPNYAAESGWGFGFADGEGWIPYAALSDSEQMVCGAALTVAMLDLGGRSFRPVVLDGLEALETPRALRLVAALAAEQTAGRLSLVLCALRTHEDGRDDQEVAGAVASGIVVVDTCGQISGPSCASASVPSASVPSAALCAPEPPAATSDEPREYVWCVSENRRLDAAVHASRGCKCNAAAQKPAEKPRVAAARTPVDSSNIVAIGYDDERQELIVEFKNGALWAYEGVSPEEHSALMTAESIGRHFAAQIRKRKTGHELPQPAA